MSAPDGRAGIDADLVRRLVAAQFPQWSGLTVRPVEVDGWDNRTYRLGEQLLVRLPTAPGYVPGIAKEDRWLPVLAPCLTAEVPSVVVTGSPGEGYPFPWSVRAWIPGETARLDRVEDPVRLALDVAAFLRELWSCDTAGAPAAGPHSAFRGVPPGHYDDDTTRCLARLGGVVDTIAAARVWTAACASQWTAPPVWFHGDVAAGNLLVREGQLVAVIDFGTCGVGDPACDLVLAWTLLPE
ncbi:MAG: aminoglycoside phosphotransferase family protein, partial [Phycicoccus sp.]